MSYLQIIFFLFLSINLYGMQRAAHLLTFERAGGLKICAPKVLPAEFSISIPDQSCLFSKIRHNSHQFQRSSGPLIHSFFELLKTLQRDPNKQNFLATYNLVKDSSKIHPLFLCSECGSTTRLDHDLNACPLERKRNIKLCPRTSLLEKIVEDYGTPSQGIIFYASGGNWFETQAMTEFLLNSATFTRVIFIEPDNRFTFDDLESFEQNLHPERGYSDIDVNTLRRIYRTIQMAYFIWSINPLIEFHFYRSDKEYLADKDNHMLADFLISMDPIDGAYDLRSGEFVDAVVRKREMAALISALNNQGVVAIKHRLSAANWQTATILEKKDEAIMRLLSE